MQKILLFCLLLVLLAFNVQLHTGRGGKSEDDVVRDKIKAQILKNKDDADRNQMMLIKIDGLKGATDAMEARARYELNLVKPGEVLVKLPVGNTEKKD